MSTTTGRDHDDHVEHDHDDVPGLHTWDQRPDDDHDFSVEHDHFVLIAQHDYDKLAAALIDHQQYLNDTSCLVYDAARALIDNHNVDPAREILVRRCRDGLCQ